MNNQLPIGVFDSGMGGLTVLKALKAYLPNESFIYLGDTARLPYGTKSAETVRQYAVQMARILIERRIKALVMACNTATTAALSYLQTILPGLPVIGVVEPGALAVIEATCNRRVMVLATQTTIASAAYQKLIMQHLPDAIITPQACSLLVALAEEGMIDNRIAQESLRHYLASFCDEDTLLLGCTHFPVFKPLLTQMLPPYVKIVDSAFATAQHTASALEKNGLLQDTANNTSETLYLVTDLPARFQQVGEIFLGESLGSADIEVVDTFFSNGSASG